MADYLSALPPEILCMITEDKGLTISEVKALTETSSELRDIVRSCLKHLRQPKTQYFGGETLDYYPSPAYLSLFPRLTTVDMAIEIKTPDDITEIASHPSLRDAYFDFIPFYKSLEKLFGARDINTDFTGFQVVPKPGLLFFLPNLTEALTYFFYLYKSKHDRPYTSFSFRLPRLTMTFSPNRLCLSRDRFPSYFNFVGDLWDEKEFFDKITPINKISYYNGSWPPPPITTLVSVEIKVEDFPLVNSEGVNTSLVIDYLRGNPGIRHLGLYIGETSGATEETLVNFYLLEDIEERGLVFDNIEVYTAPVSIIDLGLVRRVFPNIKEVLLAPFDELSQEEEMVFTANSYAFRRFLISRYHRYPDAFLEKFTVDTYDASHEC
jgi:hypothetical protein